MSDQPLNSEAQGQLQSVIDRIEHLEMEKAEVSESIKEVYAEAKGNGFDVAILRKVIALRKMDKAARDEMEALVELYMRAAGS